MDVYYLCEPLKKFHLKIIVNREKHKCDINFFCKWDATNLRQFWSFCALQSIYEKAMGSRAIML